MKRVGMAGLAVLLGCGMGASAIDRGARMIDTAALNVAELDDVDSIGGSLWVENVFAVPNADWAMLAGVGYDEISPDGSDNVEAWTLGLGLKHYILPVTSVSLIGAYTRFNEENGAPERDTKAATVTLTHRLLPADEPISPFLKGALTWRDRSTFSDFEPQPEEDSFSEVLVTLGGGAEFAMGPAFTFVFDVGLVIADQSADGAEDMDGVVGSVAMRYYFDGPNDD